MPFAELLPFCPFVDVDDLPLMNVSFANSTRRPFVLFVVLPTVEFDEGVLALPLDADDPFVVTPELWLLPFSVTDGRCASPVDILLGYFSLSVASVPRESIRKVDTENS
jgi:hypothetical protein